MDLESQEEASKYLTRRKETASSGQDLISVRHGSENLYWFDEFEGNPSTWIAKTVEYKMCSGCRLNCFLYQILLNIESHANGSLFPRSTG